MKPTHHIEPRDAFTLIELLIVIAIIGVLAGLLTPAVRNAMIRGQAIAVGNNGRQIWLGLYANNSESGDPDTWPSSDVYADSTEFFRDCIASNWLGNKFTFTFMGAPGISEAATVDPAEFEEVNNAWCVVLDTGDETYDQTPFMFTRNFIASGGGTTLADIDALDPEAEPFGDRLGVVVTYGGAVRTVTHKQLGAAFLRNFNPMEEENPVARP